MYVIYLRINLLMKQVYKTSTQIIDPTVDINMDACLVDQSCLILWDPKDCSLPCPSPGDLPDPGIKPECFY